MFRRIAIIGGGAAAAALLSELLARQRGAGLHVDWYTGGETQARGIAYGTQSDRHLLNVRAASMSMFSGQPQGFLDYARQHDASVAGTDFLPRRLYGDYLQNEVAKSLQRARESGADVQMLPFVADALVPEPGGITVIQSEDSRRVDAAVLAIGALPPQPLAGVSEAALASGRYITSPWAFLNRLDHHAPPPREVLLVGLGLTAIDVLLELSARWPDTRFTTVSRHGLPPEAHRAKAAAPQDDGGELIEAMRDAPAIGAWMALLREAISHGSDWRTVIDSLRPHTPALWQSLPHDEQARFLRHARWAWERVRHRMPPQVAASMQALESAGRLQRLRGRVRQVEPDGQRLAVSLRSRDATAGTVQADLVIQTIGLNTDVRQTPHPLISQLRTNGHIQADPLGLGLLASSDGRLCHGSQHWPNLFAIGSLLRSRLWESTAMPEIRQQARSLAEQLLAP